MWGLIKKGLGFIPFNKALIVAVLACAALGWMLLQQHQKTGELEAQLSQWQQANEHWSQAWQAREAEHLAAQARMDKRDDNYRKIQGDLNDYRKRLQKINAQNDGADCRISNDAWVLIRDSAKNPIGAARSAAGSESGTAENNANP